MADLLQELNERIKALAGDWTKYTVVGSFFLYVAGYLALRFHLTAIGVGTDLAVLDERYLFTGARFLVYLVSSVPIILIVALPLAVIFWVIGKALPASVLSGLRARIMRPRRLAVAGIVFAVIIIQFVMRQCFAFNNLLLAPALPSQPAWLAELLLHDEFMPLYFSALVAACAVPLAIAIMVRHADVQDLSRFLKGLLVFLAAVQVLLLPVNYGVLIVDKALPRVASLGGQALPEGEEAWLVWEGKEGFTYLVQDQARARRLVTVPRAEIKRTEIVGFDRIVPRLFGTH